MNGGNIDLRDITAIRNILSLSAKKSCWNILVRFDISIYVDSKDRASYTINEKIKEMWNMAKKHALGAGRK